MVSRAAEGRALRKLIYRTEASSLRIERRSVPDLDNSYIATIESVDVCGANIQPGHAWLFSPYYLKSLKYAAFGEQEPIAAVRAEIGNDLKGDLIVDFKQVSEWEDWPIYEIAYDDAAEVDAEDL